MSGNCGVLIRGFREGFLFFRFLLSVEGRIEKRGVVFYFLVFIIIVGFFLYRLGLSFLGELRFYFLD